MQNRSLFIACSILVATVLISGILCRDRKAAATSGISIGGPTWGSAHRYALVPRLQFGALTTDQDLRPLGGGLEVFSPKDELGLLATRTNDHPGEVNLPSLFGSTQMPAPSLSFEGLKNFDNGPIYNYLIIPPDMTGDVGPSHYVQATNSLLRVFDKDGVALTPPFKISKLFEPLGSACSTRNDGLPNVLYDTLADRWLISQQCTAFPPFRQMIAVSTSGDPLGPYHSYEFAMPNIRLNDFGKFGIWPDGYYMSTDEFFGSDYSGSGMFAFDRERMLDGDATAGYVYFYTTDPAGIRRRGFLPSDLDGLRPPPANSPNIFISFAATEYGDGIDALRLFEFKADFRQPELSTFTELAESPLLVTAFDPTSPAGRADIAQPPPGEKLDSQSDRLGHRLAYRNIGSYESLVVSQTVRMTPPGSEYRAGIRVYELRRNGGNFVVSTSATLGDVESSRWIGSAAQDHSSNIAVGYNFVSDTKRVSINYSGRTPADPTSVFRAENSLIEGTGVQKAFGWRWGEYSGMSVDPSDDCTFWLTNAYYSLESEQASDFGWLTRIGRFKFQECEPAIFARISGIVTDARTGSPITKAKVRIGRYRRDTNPGGLYGPASILPGSYQMTVEASGYRQASRDVNASGDFVENFALEPIPTISSHGIELVSESCTINNAAEPGEIVTVSLGLQNTGERDAVGVTAQVVSGGRIVSSGELAHYGSLPVGKPPIYRPLSFLVSPNTPCGSNIQLRFRIRELGNELNIIEIPLTAGAQIISFQENFDSVAAPSLPAGWTTSTTANHQLWRGSSNRSESAPNAAFSPAPIQMGVNELVSPPFSISSGIARVKFRNWYELETTFLRNRLYDGSVLEIKIGSGQWEDILAAGGSFVSGRYDGVIDSCCSNPLAGRQGWSGRSGVNQTSEFITTEARLPAKTAGNTVQLRWRVGTDIGTFREGQYIDDLVVTDGFACSCSSVPTRAPFDLDNDGRTDLSVFDLNDDGQRPDFRGLRSADGTLYEAVFGGVGDIPAVADFDGDGKVDIAVFRPSVGVWFISRSSDGNIDYVSFGLPGDIPFPADYDGDNRADIALFRPSTGVWYLLQSSLGFAAAQFGLADDIPVTGDYDGDGRDDIAVFRPSTGVWYIARSSGGFLISQFGLAGDRPIPGDFDGDGKTDLVVFRPSEGIWYLMTSTEGLRYGFFGLGTDEPLQADFDGDGRSDIAVYRGSDQVWYYIQSSDSAFRAHQFGSAGERPVPGIFVR